MTPPSPGCLYPYQDVGADWLAARNKAGLMDEQGLGKTITALVALSRCRPTVGRVLILVPTVVAWNWHREISRWLPGRTTQLVLSSRQKLTEVRDAIVVTTHGLMIRPQMYKALTSQTWDLVILDEAHLLRSADAQRTRAFYGRPNGVIYHANRVWVMTGTPIPNNVSELWPLLRALWPERCPWDFDAFRAKFCTMVWSEFTRDWKVVGNRNILELKRVIDGLFLRRLKKDVLKELPAQRWETVVLRPEKLPGELARVLDEVGPKVRALLQAAQGPDEAFGILARSEAFARYRRLCGLAKVESTAELLRMELQNDPTSKVLVVACHLDVIRGLADELAPFGVVTFTGEVSAGDRAANVEAFQHDPKTRVAISQVVAGGVGITLTAASEVVFVEQSFVPGENSQAADRVHRIGQTRPVRIRCLGLAGTVDELVTETLARKSRMIAQVLG